MPKLVNQRQERFVQELAKGQTADRAYQLAGYRANRGNAAALKAKKSIQDRLAELISVAAASTGVTIATINAKLNAAYDVAKDRGQPAAMVGAAMGQARLYGLVRDVPVSSGITVNNVLVQRIVRVVVDPDRRSTIEND